jgi:hypothetical protein
MPQISRHDAGCIPAAALTHCGNAVGVNRRWRKSPMA